jgi:hypothetical protein
LRRMMHPFHYLYKTYNSSYFADAHCFGSLDREIVLI